MEARLHTFPEQIMAHSAVVVGMEIGLVLDLVIVGNGPFDGSFSLTKRPVRGFEIVVEASLGEASAGLEQVTVDETPTPDVGLGCDFAHEVNLRSTIRDGLHLSVCRRHNNAQDAELGREFRAVAFGVDVEAVEHDVLHFEVCIDESSRMNVAKPNEGRLCDGIEFLSSERAFGAGGPEGRLAHFEHQHGRTTITHGRNTVHLSSDGWTVLEELVHDHFVLETGPSRRSVVWAGLFEDDNIGVVVRLDGRPYVGLTER